LEGRIWLRPRERPGVPEEGEKKSLVVCLRPGR